MKKVLLIVCCIAAINSCSKNENNESATNPCTVILKAAIPAVVQSAFQNKYPANTVITWFRKDSIGYCAYFIELPGSKKISLFDNLGMFIAEEIDLNQDGNFEDSTDLFPKAGTGCECEIPE